MGKKKAQLKQRLLDIQIARKRDQDERDARKAARKQKALESLAKHKMPEKLRTKKIPYQEHVDYFSNVIDPCEHIRNPTQWEPKTYNLYRQRISYLQWVICKYHVPLFLLDTLMHNFPVNRLTDERRLALPMYQNWATSVGSGMSLYKIAKKILTKKECHHFLKFKDGSAEENIWRARCTRHGVRATFTKRVVELLIRRNTTIYSPQWIEFVEFLGKNQDAFEHTSLMEIMDFLNAQFTQLRTLKGRTVSSLTRMSNEWHQVMGRTKGSYTEWGGMGIRPWSFQFKDDPTFWFITEILDSKDLYTEGNKLRHCVGSYSKMCIAGQIHIFSLRNRSHKESAQVHRCVTIEVQSSIIRQARRRMNKRPTAEELSIIRRWAQTNRISVDSTAFSSLW